MAKFRMSAPTEDVRDAETMVALSDALDDPTFKRALIDSALELLAKTKDDRTLCELFDLDGAESDIKLRHSRIELGQTWNQLRELVHDDQSRLEWLETAVLSDSDHDAILDLTKRGGDYLDAVFAILQSASSRTIQYFGPKAARLLASATQNGGATRIPDREGMAALALRLNAPYLAALSKALSLAPQSDQIEDDEIEANARVLLAYDDTGFLPWAILAFSQWRNNKIVDAAAAAKRALENDATPFYLAAYCCIIVAAEGTSDLLPYLLKALVKLKPDAATTTRPLNRLAELVLKLGKGRLFLAAWDATFPSGELLPFREALNAAAHNDGSLLELLAPEVKEPARQFLAVIAPKLLQKSEE